MFAKMCSEISQLIVSTDSEEIASIARQYGAEIPFIRPMDLATDSTPMWPVLKHALQQVEIAQGTIFETLLLLDVTSPARDPEDVTEALKLLSDNVAADGVIGVSRPDFNPIWTCVVNQDGWIKNLIEDGNSFGSRQEVPPVYRINGSLYLWRCDFIRKNEGSWLSIDDVDQFNRAELLVETGFIKLPWLENDLR